MEDPKRILWGKDIPVNAKDVKFDEEFLEYCVRKHDDEKPIWQREAKYEAFFIYPSRDEYCQIDIYEPHDWFWLEEQEVYILYGHEEILVIRPDGVIVAKKHTR